MDDKLEKTEKLKKELQGMALGAAGIFLLIALASFNVADSSPNSFSSEAGYHNFGGMFGAQFADLLLEGFGLAAYLVPLSLLYLAYRLLRFKELRWRAYKGVAFLGLLISLASLFAFWGVEKTRFLGQMVSIGGLFGIGTARVLKGYLGISGALLLLLPMLAASIMVMSRFSFVLFADWWINTLGDRWSRFRERRALNRELAGEKRVTAETVPPIRTAPVPPPPAPPLAKKEKKKDEEKQP